MKEMLPTIFGSIFGEPLKMASSVIMNTIWCTFDIHDLQYQLEPGVMTKYFKHIPKELRYEYNDMSESIRESRNSRLDGEFVDMYRYKGTAIFLIKRNLTTPRSDGVIPVRTTMCFRIRNTQRNIDNLFDFMKKLKRESVKVSENNDQEEYKKVIDNGSLTSSYRPVRSFNDVFIPDEQQQQIENSIRDFVSKRKWYKDHHIPYHFGIILHGEPGTGKSSIIQAIINLIKCHVLYIPTNELINAIENPHMLQNNDSNIPKFIIIEDIDAAAISKDRNKFKLFEASSRDEEMKARHAYDISTLLNVMDGFDNPENVIYILTTNHLDDLDPALIRPGRIDLMLEINYLTHETLDKFVCYHYGKHIPEDFEVRMKLTCAELQTKVMQGYTYEQLMEYAKR